MSYDERALDQLIEESEDLQSDAMRTTRTGLAEMVEIGTEKRAHGGYTPEEDRAFALGHRRLMPTGGAGLGGLLAAGGFGTALLRWLSSPALAQGASQDVATMQTAAALENLAVATYGVALTLPFMAGVPDVVKAFATKTKDQHAEHAKAFNAAAKQLGGAEQTKPHPGGLTIVEKAKPGLKTPGDVVNLAIELETIAAQTYVAFTSSLTDVNARKAVASVMGVEAQHISILNAVKALLGADLARLITLPPAPLTDLPAAAGAVGFPDAFLKTDKAVPADSGATK